MEGTPGHHQAEVGSQIKKWWDVAHTTGKWKGEEMIYGHRPCGSSNHSNNMFIYALSLVSFSSRDGFPKANIKCRSSSTSALLGRLLSMRVWIHSQGHLSFWGKITSVLFSFVLKDEGCQKNIKTNFKTPYNCGFSGENTWHPKGPKPRGKQF